MEMTEYGWHLQVCHQEWMVWWYGPRKEGLPLHFGHIYPAYYEINFPGDKLKFAYPLPKEPVGGQMPVVYERPTCWGWRFRTNDGIHDTGWKLADSREQAITEATQWIEKTTSIRENERNDWRRWVQDVREYPGGPS